MVGDSRQLQIKEVFTNELLCCDEQTSLYDAVAKMRANRVSSIFITQDDNIVGIWTESDCVKLTLRQKLYPTRYQNCDDHTGSAHRHR